MSKRLISRPIAVSTVNDGVNGTSYVISLAGSVFAYDPNTGDMVVNIIGRVYKSDGSKVESYTPTASQLKLTYGGGTTTATWTPTVSGGVFTSKTHDGDDYEGEGSPTSIIATLTVGGVEVARDSVQVTEYGKSGESVVMYSLVASRTVIDASSSGVPSDRSTITITAYRTLGDVMEEFANGVIKVSYVTSSGTTTYPSSPSAGKSIGWTLPNVALRSAVATLTVGGVDRARVDFVINKQGSVGKVGPNAYYAGPWEAKEYVATDYERPYVSAMSGTTIYFYMLAGSKATSAQQPPADGTSTTYWTYMQNQDLRFIMTEVIFTAFAKLGSSIYNEDYQFSQYGYVPLVYEDGVVPWVIVNEDSDSETKQLYRYFDPAHPFGYMLVDKSDIDVTARGTIVSSFGTFVAGKKYVFCVDGYRSGSTNMVVRLQQGSVILATATIAMGNSLRIEFTSTVSGNCTVFVNAGTGHINRLLVNQYCFVPNMFSNFLQGEFNTRYLRQPMFHIGEDNFSSVTTQTTSGSKTVYVVNTDVTGFNIQFDYSPSSSSSFNVELPASQYYEGYEVTISNCAYYVNGSYTVGAIVNVMTGDDSFEVVGTGHVAKFRCMVYSKKFPTITKDGVNINLAGKYVWRKIS